MTFAAVLTSTADRSFVYAVVYLVGTVAATTALVRTPERRHLRAVALILVLAVLTAVWVPVLPWLPLQIGLGAGAAWWLTLAAARFATCCRAAARRRARDKHPNESQQNDQWRTKLPVG